MGKETRKSFRINIFCSVLVIGFLLGVPVISAWSGMAGSASGSGVGDEIKADPLGRLPTTPAEAHDRALERGVGWPSEPLSAGGRSSSSVCSGVRVSIPHDTVSGFTYSPDEIARVELERGGVLVGTVDDETDSKGLFVADLSDYDILSGDTVKVTDLSGGSTVSIDCTLTAAVDVADDEVTGTTILGNEVDVYICTPSTYLGDVPPGAAHRQTTGAAWTADFSSDLNLRAGDTAYVYSTNVAGNSVMNVAHTGGSLVVYPQYDDVLGFYDPGPSLEVHAGSATMDVGTGKDGFFEAWFTDHDIVPGETVSCDMGGGRSIAVADITANCDPASNHVTGSGPASRNIRLTMNPYSSGAVVYQSQTNAQGAFDINLGSRYTATGSEVYNVAWYDSDGDAVVYEFQSFSWHLAEGYTGLTPGGGGFDTYVLIQNPGDEEARATLTFQVDQGAAEPKIIDIGAGQRVTVHLDELPGLSDASVSTKVTSTGGGILNAERSMYFCYEGKLGGHDSVGTLTPSTTWYLAEGYTGLTPGGGGFDTWVLVQNPGTQVAHVTLEFQLDQGTARNCDLAVAPGTRQQVHLDELPGLDYASVSTKVVSDVPVVAERAMYFTYEGKMGGHNSIGVTAPRKAWYLAEGYTGMTPGDGGFDTWVMIQNPGTETAHVKLKFQLDEGTAPDCDLTIPGGMRQQVHLDELPGLAYASVSTKVTSDVDVVVERAMYFTYETRAGGHNSKGAEAPSRGWYLPEGYTGGTPGGGAFDTWVLVQNPGTSTARVTMKFQLEDGTAPDYVFDLPAGTRHSAHLNALPGLAGKSVSTTVTSTLPVVAERAVYFNYYGIDGGTDSVGIPFEP